MSNISERSGNRTNVISRRNFIKGASTTAVGAIGVAGMNCSNNRNKVKNVTLGRTGIKVSQFFGDRMSDRKMYELAIASGVNYWHKIGHWADPAPYDLFNKLDRDSFYCDTTVGSLDRGKAIKIFESCLKKTGLECIDGFKIHSQYRNAEDIRTKMGAVQAFEHLKKQGKTRFLMMSQHINTSEIFEAAVESELFDVIQIPVNPTVPKDYFTKEVFPQKTEQDEYLAIIKKAADKKYCNHSHESIFIRPEILE
ncbi:twin-arginine translocation signal domain-containing protein [Candidatus Latescibacterota bacterium]